MAIDLIQHKTFQEKRNLCHNRFTHKTDRFWLAKLMDIWRKSSFCCSRVQNLKIPLKKGTFACETDFLFLAFFTVISGDCGLYDPWKVRKNMKNIHLAFKTMKLRKRCSCQKIKTYYTISYESSLKFKDFRAIILWSEVRELDFFFWEAVCTAFW